MIYILAHTAHKYAYSNLIFKINLLTSKVTITSPTYSQIIICTHLKLRGWRVQLNEEQLEQFYRFQVRIGHSTV